MTRIGDFTHLEIPADDPARARRFYEEMFGWRTSEMDGFPDYYLFRTPSEGLGGAIGKRGVNTRDGVVQYVEVESIDDALSKATELGGQVLTPKSDVSGQGWYAIVADSEGNEIGLWETTAATS